LSPCPWCCELPVPAMRDGKGFRKRKNEARTIMGKKGTR